jgi:Eco57I restriction endonuclease.
MVENSLGRLWLEGHPNEELKSKWKYYLEEAEQEPEVQKQLEEIRAKSRDIKPEDIKVLDPAMGSGHILVYAFDVLYDIYKSAGYSERDIPRLILENNLYGLDIDDRAAQLAYFAVMMKARSKSRRIFREKVNLNICSIQESNGISREALEFFLKGADEKLKADVEYLVKVFYDAKEYGSILEVKPVDFDAIERRIEEIRNGGTGDLFEYQYRNIILEKIPALVKQARIMSQKYDVVVTNPPYMGNKGINDKLKEYIVDNFESVKADLFAVFIVRCLKYAKIQGNLGFMTPFVWMFIPTYSKLREFIISQKTITSLVQLEYSGFDGATVPICTFTLKNVNIPLKGEYIRLSDFKGVENQPIKTLEAIKDPNISYRFSVNAEKFLYVPGNPIVYWLPDLMIKLYNNKKIKDIAISDGQTKTGDNDRFLRLIWEVDANRIGKDRKWVFHAKGGPFRRWSGNIDTLIDWSAEAREHYRKDRVARIAPEYIWFRKGITWGLITSGENFGVRLL